MIFFLTVNWTCWKVRKFEIDCWFLLLFYFILCMFCIFVCIIFVVKNYDCFMFIFISLSVFSSQILILLVFCFNMYWPTDNSDILRLYSDIRDLLFRICTKAPWIISLVYISWRKTKAVIFSTCYFFYQLRTVSITYTNWWDGPQGPKPLWKGRVFTCVHTLTCRS